jgi:CubicO group peptidase (beta-lactamase class C family)
VKSARVYFALLSFMMTAGSPAAVPGELNQALQLWVNDGFPSLSVAVANSCGVIWQGAAADAALTSDTASTSNAYGIGSITKTFVAVVVMQLAEAGKLSLDQTPADVLGPTPMSGIPNTGTARLRELMNHTSGIPSWEEDPRWIREARGARYDPQRHWSAADDLAYIRGAKPLAAPGVLYHYSNTNYTILGLVIEKVTGHTLAQEIRRRILEPLKLRHTYLDEGQPVPRGLLPRRYHFATEEFKRTAGISNLFPEIRPGLIDVSRSRLASEWAAGALVATASDLATFAVALRDGRLVTPSSFQFMTEWRTAEERREVGHGLFRVTHRDGSHEIGNTGNVLGFTADMWWAEQGDSAIVALSNAGSVGAGDIPLKPIHSGVFNRQASAFANEHRGLCGQR